MKYLVLLSITSLLFVSGCTSKSVSNANINDVSIIPSNSVANSNTNSKSNSNSPLQNSNQSKTVSSEPLPQANPELLKQIEEQQKETADPRDAARRSANTSNNTPQPKRPSGSAPKQTW